MPPSLPDWPMSAPSSKPSGGLENAIDNFCYYLLGVVFGVFLGGIWML